MSSGPTSAAPTPPQWTSYEHEALELIRELTRLDTSNPSFDPSRPPGNETGCAEVLARRFEEAGLETDLIESAPGRGNVVARLRGTGDGPSLLLLSHLDVAPVLDAPEWELPPFSAELRDGEVWGRGTVDCKSLTSMQAQTALYLARERLALDGDLIVAAVADEKARAGFGAEYLLEHHPEKVTADYVINEGGGMPVRFGKAHTYVIDVAEKGLYWLELTAKGRGGHSAMPGAADNAMVRVAALAGKLQTHRTRANPPKLVRRLITNMLVGHVGWAGHALAALWFSSRLGERLVETAVRDPQRIGQLDALMRPTLSPNAIVAAGDTNIVPSRATLTCDCRMLPGQTKEAVHDELRRAGVDLDEFVVSEIHYHEGSGSPVETEFYDALAETLVEMVPGAQVQPFLLPTASDSYLFRDAGSTVYGFQPFAPDDDEAVRRIHDKNERLKTSSLSFGAEAMLRATARLVGSEETKRAVLGRARGG